LSRIWLGVRGASAHELSQGGIERVLGIRAIEPLIPIASANDQVCGLELGKLILNRAQREKAKPRQLARVELLAALSKEQPQYLRPHDRK
jgi:hypothetical protein